jgi:ABC-type branched-subunit amino acid transport system substrate-binding protein
MSTADGPAGSRGNIRMWAAAGAMTLATAASVGIGGGPAGAASSKPPLYILADVDLSGNFGHYGQVDLQGLQGEAKLLNSEGGVNGRKIVIKDVDNQSDAATAVIAAKQLLSSVPSQNVLFFYPGAVGVTTLAILPVTSAAKVVTISPSAVTETENLKAFPYTFIDYPDEVMQAAPQVAAVKQLAGTNKKVGMLVGSDSGDQANIGPLTKSVNGDGLKLVSVQTVPLTGTDFTPQLQQLKQAGASVIYVKIDTPSAYVTAMQGVQELGWKNVKVLAGPTAANAAVLNVIPPAVTSQFYALGERMYMQGYNANNPAFTKFYKALASTGTVTDIGISTNTADMEATAVWAYKKAGNTTTQSKIKAALNGIGKSNLPPGTLLALPQPHYSKTVQDLANANFSTFWALLRGGQPVNGQWAGLPLNLALATNK